MYTVVITHINVRSMTEFETTHQFNDMDKLRNFVRNVRTNMLQANSNTSDMYVYFPDQCFRAYRTATLTGYLSGVERQVKWEKVA